MITKHLNKIIVLFLSFIAISTQAQSNTNWLENTMFQSGKINVVIAVLGVVFVLITAYLISLDIKLRRMETEENKERS
ncbi:MAG TPA: hypothetical protein VJ911_01830 [Cryomorphaceae bacterium]|nr:hypothetical protein [Cryomorphaceae bacterium]